MSKKSRYSWLIAAAIALLAGPNVRAQDRLVQAATDPVSGAAVRVYRTPGGTRVEMEGSGVTLRKELDGRTVRTSIASGRDSLTITQTADRLVVKGARGQTTVIDASDDSANRARQIVAASTAAAKAADLIGRLALGEHSPLKPVLMTTRAMLLDARGDERGTTELVAWVKTARSARVVKTADDRTPTECWRAYQAEIRAAWEEQAECFANVKWWNPLGNTGCAIIFDLRVIGAFTWYLSCVKLLGFILD